MDWNDPIDRLRLAETVGPDEYNRQHAEHLQKSTLTTVAGHAIRPVSSRFGRLFMVGSTGKAFLKMSEAKQYAENNPV